MAFHKVDQKQTLPKMEEEILKFWQENKIFEKSVQNREGAKEYTFFDGPPFATGTPHYGHLVGSIMKDAVPRYWTMRGYKVERKWGWDCHGLPIENIVEKELGSKSKAEIEKLGVEKFNELCRSKVLTYVEEWKKVITRIGRWADMDNAYKTMDLSYMESVWWVFKQLWDKGLIYEGYRSMHVCPRCETTLSQQEVSEGYIDIKDLSAIAKFELTSEKGTFILAWTTTPWTLIGNVALAVGENIEYVKVKEESSSDFFIVAKERLGEIFKEKKYEIISEMKGQDLVGKKYKPLFDYYAKNNELENKENGWQVASAEFVTTTDGTGIVHIAPAFGEDDLNLGKEKNLPFIQHVEMNGIIKKEAGEFSGMHVKDINDHMKTDIEIIKYLAKAGLLFAKEKYEHSYPHCWRCDTPLINYATGSWFVNVIEIKKDALEFAKDINWSPQHIKEGRFGNWLSGARDWSISRQRFWASVMPIWKCDCGEMKVFGSASELEKISGEKITDLHKHTMDKIVFKCEKCKGEMRRIPDVLDTWFDSGSMPYAQNHYPFENAEKFDKSFPADFIAEGVDQTRAWFYYLHILGSAIKKSNTFKNVIVNGIVQAEDGKKMSKRLNNYPDPMMVIDKYGADSLRLYLMSSPVVAAQNLNFSEKEMSELVRGMMRMLWNSYSFFVLYAEIDKWEQGEKNSAENSKHFLDKWILSELNKLILDFNEAMKKYELNKAARLLPNFVDNLSNWYIRRSRKRFWKSESDEDKNSAYATLHYALLELSKLMAPFTPFISEEIYKNLSGKESVHLADFPISNVKLIDEKLNENMANLREVISLGLQERAVQKIKVRQPLAKIILGKKYEKLFSELISGDQQWKSILTEELNVKDVVFDEKIEILALDIEISHALKLEGMAREFIRQIQEMRKEAGYQVDNRIEICYKGESEVFSKMTELIKKETLAVKFFSSEADLFEFKKEIKSDSEIILVSIKKVD